MNAKRKVLSDHQLVDRLIYMRLLADEQTVNRKVMPVFADISSGCSHGISVPSQLQQNCR